MPVAKRHSYARQSTTIRIRAISAFIFILGFGLIIRLYIIQIHEAAAYRDKAERQYVHTAKDVYDRGSIYFTTKDGEQVSAASITSGYLMAVNPTIVTDGEAVYNKIASFLTVSKDVFIERTTMANRTYVEVEPKMSKEHADALADLKVPGVMLYRNTWRYYPGGDVAARTIGFVGYLGADETQLHGKYGLERYYDDTLMRDNTVMSVNFFAEIFSNLGNLVYENKSEKVGDVVTTIEPTVSRMLDRVLQETQDTYHSKMTGGIIMDPKTGAIYAMNVAPTFNLNEHAGVSLDTFDNPLVQDVYEMGSIIKPLTMAAGLDSKVVTPNSTYYDSGLLELNTKTIRNFDGKARGTVSMQEVLNQSLNTGVAHVVSLMGNDRFRKYFLGLQLGSETGIDMPSEAHGLVSTLDSPRDVDYATASFGQGIAMSPIETIRALATLGNGGHLITPHLASKIAYEDGTSKDITYPNGAQVYSAETSETITRMLTTVVDKALRHGEVALPDHSVAAKTGTAQIAIPGGGGYYDDRYLHSFFGYFPSYDPKFIVFLYTVEPKNVQYASETLTMPFMDITKFLINYYSIPPDR
jgi:cell division protein FtsI (penicillin-binding protein 3)/stage V sporulation protein D (sporulation-specific penicillin-binding protein)